MQNGIRASRRAEVYARDDYTCQCCGASGGRLGTAALDVHHILSRERGGSDRTINLLTVCLDCRDALVADEQAGGPRSTYLSRFADLIERVAAAQVAAEEYVDACRERLDSTEFDELTYDQRLHVALYCFERVEDGVQSVETIPDSAWPVSTDVCEYHQMCLSTWQGWAAGSRQFVKQIDDRLDTRRSGTRECPVCDGGIWPDDLFCRLCGTDLHAESGNRADDDHLSALVAALSDALDSGS